VSAGQVLYAGPGTAATRSATGGSAFEWVGHTVALRPALGPPSVTLSWTPSPSSWATGYRVERSVGATVQATTPVTPISASSASEGPLTNATTYSYRLWAYHGTWVSSAVTATASTSC